MKTICALAAAVSMTALTGCFHIGGWNEVKGDGNVITETRNVTGFQRVAMGGAGQITIVQGNEEGLTIETDSNLLAHIKKEVSNGRLWIGPENVNLRPTKEIQYHLRVKSLEALDCSGAIHARAEEIKAEKFELESSGASSMQIASLTADQLTGDISGAAHVQLGGIIRGGQKVDVSGAANYDAEKLQSDRGQIDASGAAHARLTVKGDLSAEASGAASIVYACQGNVHANKSGAASVRAVSE